MAVLELDYYEYATDPIAQAAYVTDSSVDGQTDFIDSGDTGHSVTAVGNAQLDTAQKKFGRASMLSDGAGDCLSVPHHVDWYFDGNFTMDFQVRFKTLDQHLKWGQKSSNGDWWEINWNKDNYRWIFYIYDGDGAEMRMQFRDTANWVPNLNQWYHIEITRSGNNWYIFIEGVARTISFDVGDGSEAFDDCDGILYIGANRDGAGSVDGWMDEIRISKGIARHTSGFTPPSSEHSSDSYTKLLLHCNGILGLQSYSEETIKQEGSYSLKVIAKQTDSLNDTLTKSGLSIDLSGRTELKIGFYALRTGTNIQVQIHDSGGQTSIKDIVISSADTWEITTWDISAIADVDKDNIDQIIIKIINADADNTFYVDNFYSPEVIVGNAVLFGINF